MHEEGKYGHHTHEEDAPQPASKAVKEPPPSKPEPEHTMVTPEELRKAWEKLEGYHPLTEQALGEVLEAFLANRKA